jgi:hypothetical protein
MFRIFPLFLVIAFVSAPTAPATILLLKDGGTIEGELQNPNEVNRKLYRIKTEEGLEISIDAKLVEREQSRERPALIEYNANAPLTENTVAQHLHWAKWCYDQQLSDQAKMHWQQVLELDADHAEARKMLGYYKTTTGGWESPRDKLANKGYIQHQGRWKTPYEIEVENFLENQKNEEIEWKKTIPSLYRRLPNPQAEAELLSIRHPAAFVPIRDILLKEANPQRRIMLLRLLVQMPDPHALQFVAGWSIRPDEPLEDIRKICVEELLKQMNERPEIRQIMIAVYRNSLKPTTDPAIIHLAAQVLGDIGGHEAVPELIDVLQVKVTRTYQEPQQSYSFGPGGTGFGQGSGKSINVSTPVQNQAVLSALRKLTGMNFDFDQAAWRNWYLQSLRSPPLHLRRI